MLNDAFFIGLRCGGIVAAAVFSIMTSINTIFYLYVSKFRLDADVYLAAVIYPAARAALALSGFGFLSSFLLMVLILWSAMRGKPDV